MQTDYVWDELSKVYNMPDVPDKAKSIIGDLMLRLDERTYSQMPEHTMEEFMYGQDLGSPEDGSL